MEAGYRSVEAGEEFYAGDEYYSGYSWQRIPDQWAGMRLSYADNNTLSRMKLPLRRKIKDPE